MKETFYFSHDYNATQDPKIMLLLSSCGLSGLAMYWILIEILHQQPDSRISKDSYKKYIKFYCSFEDKNEHVLNTIEQELINTQLLFEQENFIYSKRVLNNKKEREKLSELRSMAGKKSAEIRAKATSVEQVSTSVEQGKERKGKERKGNSIYKPPSLEEVKAYCLERKNNVDFNKWYDHYLANGWLVGKNKMKDWRAAVRTWEEKKTKNYRTMSDFSLLEERIRIQDARKEGLVVENNPELLEELNRRFS
jgi:hypothetical protein